MSKLIRVINKKERVYNGIKPNQIVEISEDNLLTYTDAWFVVFGASAPAQEDEAELTKAQIVEKLSELWFEAPKNMSKANLLLKLEELSAPAQEDEAE